jgi:protein TonB
MAFRVNWPRRFTVHYIETENLVRVRRALQWLAQAAVFGALIAGCSAPSRRQEPAPVFTPRPAPATTAPAATPAPVARTWDEFKRTAARRMVAANPGGAYTGAVPDPLLAIPVLEVELNADGSVRRIDVLRQPTQARDTVQLAIDAVHRSAPFGDISRLPRPWKFTEAFLFDDNRRFKPRTLD